MTLNDPKPRFQAHRVTIKTHTLLYVNINGDHVLSEQLLTRDLFTAAKFLVPFCRAMLCKRGLSRHTVSLCVCLCVIDHVKTNKHIFKFFNRRV